MPRSGSSHLHPTPAGPVAASEASARSRRRSGRRPPCGGSGWGTIVPPSAVRAAACCLGLALASLPLPASAADWRYAATFYGWLPGLSATLETPRGPVSVEQDLSDVLDQLDVAAFAAFEAQRGRWSLIGDLALADLSRTEALPPSAPFGALRLETRLTALSGYAAYRVAEGGGLGLDLAAGLRHYGLTLRGALSRPDLEVRRSVSWTDPLIGARAVWDPGTGWRGAVALDAGGFGIGSGSDLSWQAVAEVEYGLSDSWSVVFGYRHLSVDLPAGSRLADFDLSGALIGVRARF